MKKILFILFIFQSSFCFSAEPLSAAAGGMVKGAATKEIAATVTDKIPGGFTEKIGKFLSSPPGIMVVAGIGGVNAAILYKAAGDQEKENEENIKKIDKLLSVYKDSWTNKCPNGREKLEEPKCYCYLESGKQNTDRSNSQICKDLWAKNKYFLDSTAADYAALSLNSDPAGCMTITGQFDENCNCKKMVNSKGSNACMKAVAINMGDNALGSAYLKSSGFDKVMQNAASTLSGNANIGNLSDKGLALAIAKQGDLNNGLFEKLNKDPKKNMFPKIDSNMDLMKLQGAVFSKSDLQKLGSTFGGGALASVGSGLTGEKAKAIESVKAKLGLEMAGSGKGLEAKKAGKKPGMDFSFADGGSNGSGGQVLGNFPEKNYNYKNSDIVTDDGANLFEIISNRYIQSGLKRLFDDGSPTESN